MVGASSWAAASRLRLISVGLGSWEVVSVFILLVLRLLCFAPSSAVPSSPGLRELC